MSKIRVPADAACAESPFLIPGQHLPAVSSYGSLDRELSGAPPW